MGKLRWSYYHRARKYQRKAKAERIKAATQKPTIYPHQVNALLSMGIGKSLLVHGSVAAEHYNRLYNKYAAMAWFGTKRGRQELKASRFYVMSRFGKTPEPNILSYTYHSAPTYSVVDDIDSIDSKILTDIQNKMKRHIDLLTSYSMGVTYVRDES